MFPIIRACNPEEIVDLRHRVLRQGLPRSEAIFAGDDLPHNFHFGAFEVLGAQSAEQAVGCATFHLNQWAEQPAWQLRGMAIDVRWQGAGVGRAILLYAERSIAQVSDITRYWCNARLSAIPFYERMGWQVASDLFDIPTAGPHRKMFRETQSGK